MPKDLTIDDWIVCWTPANWTAKHGDEPAGQMVVARLGDDVYWSKKYAYVTGCCESNHHNRPLLEKIALMFIDLHTLVVRDRIDPQAAHREFLKIDEYRKRIAQDTRGAANYPGDW
jgi:hypothetical protein